MEPTSPTSERSSGEARLLLSDLIDTEQTLRSRLSRGGLRGAKTMYDSLVDTIAQEKKKNVCDECAAWVGDQRDCSICDTCLDHPLLCPRCALRTHYFCGAITSGSETSVDASSNTLCHTLTPVAVPANPLTRVQYRKDADEQYAARLHVATYKELAAAETVAEEQTERTKLYQAWEQTALRFTCSDGVTALWIPRLFVTFIEEEEKITRCQIASQRDSDVSLTAFSNTVEECTAAWGGNLHEAIQRHSRLVAATRLAKHIIEAEVVPNAMAAWMIRDHTHAIQSSLAEHDSGVDGAYHMCCTTRSSIVCDCEAAMECVEQEARQRIAAEEAQLRSCTPSFLSWMTVQGAIERSVSRLLYHKEHSEFARTQWQEGLASLARIASELMLDRKLLWSAKLTSKAAALVFQANEGRERLVNIVIAQRHQFVLLRHLAEGGELQCSEAIERTSVRHEMDLATRELFDEYELVLRRLLFARHLIENDEMNARFRCSLRMDSATLANYFGAPFHSITSSLLSRIAEAETLQEVLVPSKLDLTSRASLQVAELPSVVIRGHAVRHSLESNLSSCRRRLTGVSAPNVSCPSSAISLMCSLVSPPSFLGYRPTALMLIDEVTAYSSACRAGQQLVAASKLGPKAVDSILDHYDALSDSAFSALAQKQARERAQRRAGKLDARRSVKPQLPSRQPRYAVRSLTSRTPPHPAVADVSASLAATEVAGPGPEQALRLTVGVGEVRSCLCGQDGLFLPLTTPAAQLLHRTLLSGAPSSAACQRPLDDAAELRQAMAVRQMVALRTVGGPYPLWQPASNIGGSVPNNTSNTRSSRNH